MGSVFEAFDDIEQTRGRGRGQPPSDKLTEGLQYHSSPG
jgi:hypothetical protein